jgi:phosphoglycolate phosphatase-like HAD superfamily hydrolase
MVRTLIALACSLLAVAAAAQADPLPSWNDTDTKQAIIGFVDAVTDEASPDYVQPAERVATFDNDGCLWAEKPVYFQLLFAIDRVKAVAPNHPEWQNEEPFRSVIAGDMQGVMASGEEGLLKLVAASHGGITTDQFSAAVRDWLDTARHPETGMAYDAMVYQPMLELLEYLRDNGFKTFIVSGGGIDMIRVFAEDVYGIPPEQVVGSSLEATFEMRDGEPVIIKQPTIGFIDDKAGKPVGIHQHIGRRPIFAAGNSDGDLQMLQWTAAGDGLSFCLLVHHTDADREWAYDRDSHVGRLDAALDEADANGWTVVDMAEDWATVFDTK